MKNQKGFTLVEGLLIILVVSVIGFIGYYVWNQNQDQQNNADTTQQTQTMQDNKDAAPEEIADNNDLSKNWQKYESGKGSFSIKVADGLDGLRDTSSDLFIFRSFTSNTGAAKVKDVEGYGSDGFTALLIRQDDSSNIWRPTDIENLQEEQFTTTSGVKGTKKTFSNPYRPPCEGPGCYLGEKNVVYEFENGSKTLVIWYSRQFANEETKRVYSITEDSPDYPKEIEAMAKSLELN